MTPSGKPSSVIQPQKLSGKQTAVREVHTAECPTWKDQWTVYSWCGCEAAGLLPSGRECPLFRSDIEAQESLPSETTACGSRDRQQLKASPQAAFHCSDWADAPATSGWTGRCCGAAGTAELSARPRPCSCGPVACPVQNHREKWAPMTLFPVTCGAAWASRWLCLFSLF